LALLLEKLLKEFGTRAGIAARSSLLWLAGIAGSAFWIQFTNSRNLEVVGGVFLLYQGLRYLRSPTRYRLLGVAACAGVLLFADTLQLYMTVAPLLLYAGILTLRKKYTLKATLFFAISLLAGLVLSKILFAVVSHVFKLHALAAPNHTGLSVDFLKQGVVGSAKSFVHLYAGGADAGKLREACNLLFLVVSLCASAYAFWKQLIPKRLVLLVMCILTTNEIVYILSGQAGQVDTERYIVMTIPAILLLLGAAQKIWTRLYKTALIVVSALVLVNGVSLGLATVHASKHFPQDKHLASVGRYMLAHSNATYYSSMDTSLALSYLEGTDKKAPLPLSCNGNQLNKSRLFYTEKAFLLHESSKEKTTIVLDGDTITNIPNSCTLSSIFAQLGAPESVHATDDTSVVLVYSSDVRELLHY
jgi:hypothetical protein